MLRVDRVPERARARPVGATVDRSAIAHDEAKILIIDNRFELTLNEVDRTLSGTQFTDVVAGESGVNSMPPSGTTRTCWHNACRVISSAAVLPAPGPPVMTILFGTWCRNNRNRSWARKPIATTLLGAPLRALRTTRCRKMKIR